MRRKRSTEYAIRIRSSRILGLNINTFGQRPRTISLRNIFFITLLIIVILTASTQAQPLPPWQAADDIRQALFEAQKNLLTDNQAQAQAEAEKAHLVFEETLAPALQATMSELTTLISEHFLAAETAAQDGDAVRLSQARGQIWTGLLMSSYQATFINHQLVFS